MRIRVPARFKGFTLIELIVVLSILAILAATAVPRFINLQSSARAASVQGVAGAIGDAVQVASAAYVSTGILYTSCTFQTVYSSTSPSQSYAFANAQSGLVNYSAIPPSVQSDLSTAFSALTNGGAIFSTPNCLSINTVSQQASLMGLLGVLNIGAGSIVYAAPSGSTIADSTDTPKTVIPFASYTLVMALSSGTGFYNGYFFPNSEIPSGLSSSSTSVVLPACYAVYYDNANVGGLAGTATVNTSGC